AIICCITPQALQSENVRQEWAWGKSADRRMIFLRLARFGNEDVPHQFAGVNYIDLVSHIEVGMDQLRKALDEYAQSSEAQKPLKDVSWPSTERILSDLNELSQKAPDIKRKKRARAWRFLLIGISTLIVIVATALLLQNR